MIEGSANCLRWIQTCIQTVLMVENLKEIQSCTLFTQSCISLSACGRDFARIYSAKSNINDEVFEPFKADFTILFIFRLKRTGDKVLSWGTLSPGHTSQTEWTHFSPGTVDGTETHQEMHEDRENGREG